MVLHLSLSHKSKTEEGSGNSNNNNNNNNRARNRYISRPSLDNKYNYLLKTPNSYFCVKSGADRKISNERLSLNKDNNSNSNNESLAVSEDSSSEDESYLSEANKILQKQINNKRSSINRHSVDNKSNGYNTDESNKENKYIINNSLKPTSGKNGQIFFVSKSYLSKPIEQSPNNKNSSNSLKKNSNKSINDFAVKRQYISSPANKQTQSYRELIIFQNLNQLMDEKKTINFVRMVEWYKAVPHHGDISDINKLNQTLQEKEVQQQKQNNSKKSLTTTTTSDSTLKQNQYMHLILEYANLKTLQDYKTNNPISLKLFKSILFQILYALAIAQKELEFVHNDLHIGNILLETFPSGKQYIMYQDDISGEDAAKNNDESSGAQQQLYRTWVVDGVVVKLNDFGLSRIRTKEDQIIYNHKNQQTRYFLPSSDLTNLVSSLKSLRVCDVQDPCNAQDRRHLNNLKKKLTEGFIPPYVLISHPFFDSLLAVPSDATEENCIRLSSDGIIPSKFPDITAVPCLVSPSIQSSPLPSPLPSPSHSKYQQHVFAVPLATPLRSQTLSTTFTPIKTPIRSTPYKTPSKLNDQDYINILAMTPPASKLAPSTPTFYKPMKFTFSKLKKSNSSLNSDQSKDDVKEIESKLDSDDEEVEDDLNEIGQEEILNETDSGDEETDLVKEKEAEESGNEDDQEEKVENSDNESDDSGGELKRIKVYVSKKANKKTKKQPKQKAYQQQRKRKQDDDDDDDDKQEDESDSDQEIHRIQVVVQPKRKKLTVAEKIAKEGNYLLKRLIRPTDEVKRRS